MSDTVNGHCTLRLKAMENESPTSKFLFNRCIFFILVQCTLLFFMFFFFTSSFKASKATVSSTMSSSLV